MNNPDIVLRVEDNVIATGFTDMHQGATCRAYTCELFKIDAHRARTSMGKYIMKGFYPERMADSILECYDEQSETYYLQYHDFASFEAAFQQFQEKEKQIEELFEKISGQDSTLVRHHFASPAYTVCHHDTQKKQLTHLSFTEYEANSVGTHLSALEMRDKLNIMIRLCSLVNRVHHAGFMMCDLKPANFLFFKDDDSAFVQFFDYDSIAEIDERGDCLIEDYSYSGFYAGPEAYSGVGITYLFDIFSLGRILIEFVFDDILNTKDSEQLRPENLFSQSNFKLLQAKDERITASFWSVLKKIVETATNKTAEKRYLHFSAENESDLFCASKAFQKDLQKLLEIYEARGVHPEVMRDKASRLFSGLDSVNENMLTDVTESEE